MEREDYNEWYSGLRQKVLHGLRETGATRDEAERVLEQCLSFLRDDKKIHMLADSMNITLSNFQADDVLELYYDIEKEGREVSFISKGWADPGFRLGERIHVKLENIAAVEENMDSIVGMCATNGIVPTTEFEGEEGLWIDLTLNIYQDGLTANTLTEALQTIEELKRRITEILLA